MAKSGVLPLVLLGAGGLWLLTSGKKKSKASGGGQDFGPGFQGSDPQGGDPDVVAEGVAMKPGATIPTGWRVALRNENPDYPFHAEYGPPRSNRGWKRLQHLQFVQNDAGQSQRVDLIGYETAGDAEFAIREAIDLANPDADILCPSGFRAEQTVITADDGSQTVGWTCQVIPQPVGS